MGCTPAPACKAALKEATALWPRRDRASDGICGDEAHANRVSDHNPDRDGLATAFDIDHDPAGGFDAGYWADVLRRRQDPRIKYVIYNRRMFSSYSTRSRKAWEWGPYSGPNAHKHHMHVSVLPEQKRVVAAWWFDEAPLPVPQEDDVPKPTDIVRVVPAGVHGIDGRAIYKLRADGTLEFHGAKDYGDYPRLKPEQRQGERYFVDIIVDATGYTLYSNDRGQYRFDARG